MMRRATVAIALQILEEILTVAEVAADLRCSKAHVYKVIHGMVQGVAPLPAIALGRRRLIWLQRQLRRGRRHHVIREAHQ